MAMILVWLMAFAVGAYVSAIASAIGGTPLAQTIANVVGLSSLVAASVTVGEWAAQQRHKRPTDEEVFGKLVEKMDREQGGER